MLKINGCDYLTIKEAAKTLGIHRDTLHDWRKEGKVTPHKLGGRILYTPADLERLIKKPVVEPSNEPA